MTDTTDRSNGDIMDTVRDSEWARIVDVWETTDGKMCLVVERPSVMPGSLGGGGPVEIAPAYYTAYTQTTLSRDDLRVDDDVPWGSETRVDVHGGITYGPDEAGWVGFDCYHATDVCVDEAGDPLSANLTDAVRRREHIRREWSPDDVKAEIERLASQLHALETEAVDD